MEHNSQMQMIKDKRKCYTLQVIHYLGALIIILFVQTDLVSGYQCLRLLSASEFMLNIYKAFVNHKL